MRNIIFNLIFVPFVVFIATGPISAFADEQVCKKGELAIKGPDGSTSNVTIKYCKDSPDGNWQLVCGVKDPDIAAKYSGECRNGLAHGKGTAEGRDKYVGEFREGNKHGVGVYTWPKSGQYDGEWRDDKQNGKGTRTWLNGDRYEGDWVNGKRTGKGAYTWSIGERYEGEWWDDKMHGKGIKTWANGSQYDGEWRDNEFSGGFGTLRLVRGDTDIQSWERNGRGKWIGSNYVVQGLFDKRSLTRACASPADCMEQEKDKQCLELGKRMARLNSGSWIPYYGGIHPPADSAIEYAIASPGETKHYNGGANVAFARALISDPSGKCEKLHVAVGLTNKKWGKEVDLETIASLDMTVNATINERGVWGTVHETMYCSENKFAKKARECSPIDGTKRPAICIEKKCYRNTFEQLFAWDMLRSSDPWPESHKRTIAKLEQAKQNADQAQRRADEAAAVAREKARRDRDAQLAKEEAAYQATLASASPREMYLGGVNYDDAGQKERAKTVYRTLMRKFPQSQEALLASQRLTRLNDVANIESSNREAAYQAESAAQSLRQSQYDQCLLNYSSCLARCDGIKDTSARLSCKSGCTVCTR